MENRHGLVVAMRITQATGTAEREAALVMAEAMPGQQRVTWGADTNYDTRDFVRELRELRVTPHVALIRDHQECSEVMQLLAFVQLPQNPPPLLLMGIPPHDMPSAHQPSILLEDHGQGVFLGIGLELLHQ